MLISGYVTRRSGAVQITYIVEGALNGISWPTATLIKGRCHELWRQTCFELFLAIKDNSAYWEVNLSPNDCWNVYHFTDYRTEMREERAVNQPFCRIVKERELFSLSCNIDLNSLIDDSSDLEVGISSVIEATDGSTSYWAIDHHGTEPDFHKRASFGMVLPGVNKFSTAALKRSV